MKILRSYSFVHSFGFDKVYPTKLDIINIETEISSNFFFNTVDLKTQSDFSSKITNICKNKLLTVQRCLIGKFP